MSIQGSLQGAEGIKKLENILSIAIQGNSQFLEAFLELATFFIPYLKEQKLPFNQNYPYPSEVQKQVFSWMDVRYKKFVQYLNNNNIPNSPEIEEPLGSLFLNDKTYSLAPAIAACYIRFNFYSSNNSILSEPSFQDATYRYLDNNFSHESAFHVISEPFPNSQKFSSFTKLFLKLVNSFSAEESLLILKNFDGSVFSRLDEPLAAFDFLCKQLGEGPIRAALSIPSLVSVSLERAIDIPNFYQHAFNSITRESLSMNGRSKYLDTLVRVLSPKSLQQEIAIAFAVRFSRIIPLLPLSAQQDVLGVIQYLVRAHKTVAELLDFIDVAPVEIDSLDKTRKQTLWEAKALGNSSNPLLADLGQRLGQMKLPENFESFSLEEAINSIKTVPHGTSKVGNWLFGLDKSIWDI